jgi:hypothetical protein
MLIFLMVAKLQPCRPPLFSFIGKVPAVSKSPFPVPTAACTLHSRPSRARDEKQLLLSSSKTRSYTSPPNRAARNSFRIRSYENCRVSPAISRSFSSRSHSSSTLPLLSFQSLTNSKFCKSFFLKLMQTAGGVYPPCPVFIARATLHCKTRLSKPSVFFSLRTLPIYVAFKSFVCHSYENCRGVRVFFPFWNSALYFPALPIDPDREGF